MAKLIDVDELAEDFRTAHKERIEAHWEWYEILEQLEAATTIDAVPVVHGYWRKFTHSALVNWKNGEPVWADRAVYRCSECDFGTIAKHNYCPRCGARMDGGVDD